MLLGISAADGHVKWRFAPSPPETLWNYAPGLMSVTSSSGGTWRDELDPATGRVRWQVASSYRATAGFQFRQVPADRQDGMRGRDEGPLVCQDRHPAAVGTPGPDGRNRLLRPPRR